MTRVAVAGTTSWGTTLAVLLARNGADVTLWARSDDEAQALQTSAREHRDAPACLPDALTVSAGDACFAEADLVVLAVPSASLRANLRHAAAHIAPTRGCAQRRQRHRAGERPAHVGADRRGRRFARSRPGALRPNFAGEIASGLPAATVVAGRNAERSTGQTLLSGPTFRVYTSDDVAGVELGGALKNVVAIACGISDGLGYGENAKAALITRALAEITRLGVAAGARPLTFLGLARHGRPHPHLPERHLAQPPPRPRAGQSLDAAIQAIDGVVEGAVTARAVPALARKHGVELPICAALHAVLYEGLAPKDAVRELMGRASRPHRVGFNLNRRLDVASTLRSPDKRSPGDGQHPFPLVTTRSHGTATVSNEL